MRESLLCILLLGCGDNQQKALPDAGRPDASLTEVFHVCEPDVSCETGYCQNVLSPDKEGALSPPICTIPCLTNRDCWSQHTNSFCIYNYQEDHTYEDGDAASCLLKCWPEENRPVCDAYDIFCPSDCAQQGLSCELITAFPFNYACRPAL